MNTRRNAFVHSILGIAALTGISVPASAASATWAAGLSPDAVVTGKDTDGTPLYSCQMAWGSSTTPGKTRAGWTTCDIGYGGASQSATTYETLTPVWTASTYGQVPPNAIPYGSENGQPLYVCRALDSAFQYQVGKVGAGIPGCDYPYGGVEVTAPGYEVLANKFAFDIGVQSIAQGAALPYDAVRGGTDTNGAAIYPCVAPYNGGMHPGKTEAGWGTCDISYGGKEMWIPSSYQVLVPELTAAPLGLGVNEFIGGTDSNGSSLGVCAVPYGPGMQVGKLLSNNACDFAYGGSEIILTSGVQALGLHLPSQLSGNKTGPAAQMSPGGSGSTVTATVGLTLAQSGAVTFQPVIANHNQLSGQKCTDLCVLEDSNKTAYTFQHTGHVDEANFCFDCQGTSTDAPTGLTSTSSTVAANWIALNSSWDPALVNNMACVLTWQETITASSIIGDLQSALSDVEEAVGVATEVVEVVGPLL